MESGRSGCRKGKGGWRREDLVKGTGDLDSKRRNTRTRKAKGKGGRGGTAPGNNPGVETPGDRKSKTGEGK